MTRLALFLVMLIGCSHPEATPESRAVCSRCLELAKLLPDPQPDRWIYDGLAPAVQAALLELNSGDKHEAWLLEHESVHWRDCNVRASSEYVGKIAGRKQALRELGVEVLWNDELLLYEVDLDPPRAERERSWARYLWMRVRLAGQLRDRPVPTRVWERVYAGMRANVRESLLELNSHYPSELWLMENPPVYVNGGRSILRPAGESLGWVHGLRNELPALVWNEELLLYEVAR